MSPDRLQQIHNDVFHLQAQAESEHEKACLGTDRMQEGYWQGCKDAFRRVLALIEDDGDWLHIINSSHWSQHKQNVNKL